MDALQAAHLTEDDGAEGRKARVAAQHVNDMGLLSSSVAGPQGRVEPRSDTADSAAGGRGQAEC